MLQNQEKEYMNEIRKGLIVTTKLKKEVEACIYTRNPKLSELPPVLETDTKFKQQFYFFFKV